ncbi:MAG: hypothetical protein E7256_02900 [Lachnospiraceae bacterium]|nr:hypothetical protein [Lachnospiraceae bacterium]
MGNRVYDFDGMLYKLQHNRLRFLGAGSSRKVFDIGDGYVVKVAKNYRGLNQNQMEYMIFDNENTKILTPVLAISEDNRFLIMKKGDRIRNFYPVLQYYEARNMRELTSRPVFQMLTTKYMLAGGDLVRTSSWGIVNGVPMLIDYGFSHMKLN